MGLGKRYKCADHFNFAWISCDIWTYIWRWILCACLMFENGGLDWLSRLIHGWQRGFDHIFVEDV